jgi:hypothetical protein
MTDDGGPAFPCEYYSPETFARLRETDGVHAAKVAASGKSAGMSLRDWMAGKIAAALVTHYRPEQLAKYSYEIADALILERSK